MSARNGRKTSLRQAAEGAKHDAAEAFLELDARQRAVRALVEAFVDLDPGPAGASLLARHAPLTQAADSASWGWIEAVDAFAPTLDADEPAASDLSAAERTFVAVREALDRSRTAIEQFEAEHHDVARRVDDAWRRVHPSVAAAQAALAAARAAVTRSAMADARSTWLLASTSRAEVLMRMIAEGPRLHGPGSLLRYCAESTTLAAAMTAEAEQLEARIEITRRRLGTTRTRLDGTAHRVDGLGPLLSDLRRRFSIWCSADLNGVAVDAPKAVDDARVLLDRAKQGAEHRDWATAAEDLRRCREKLAAAEAGVSSVIERLRDLDAVRSDPQKEQKATWFAVRDAQRLVVTAGDKVGADEARVLDELVTRLEAVPGRLQGNHPDYWGYVVELRAIRDAAASVVRRTRAALAG